MSPLSWLFGGATFAVWKLIVAGVVATALSGLVSGFGAYNAGWRNAENAGKAAALAEQARHTDWLRKTAEKSGKLTTDDSEAEVSNEHLQGVIENAIANPPPAAPGALTVCVPDSFVLDLAKLR